jgi:acetyltransferase-like isoleucine patch superfamily enzyme
MYVTFGGKLVIKPFLIHNLFPRRCLLWALEKARSQKHPRPVVIDEDGWPGTRVSVTQNVVNQAGALPQSQAMSALCSPSLGRR